MRLDRFDLNLLVVLDVLLEERNVTRASERLCIGQSATSAASLASGTTLAMACLCRSGGGWN